MRNKPLTLIVTTPALITRSGTGAADGPKKGEPKPAVSEEDAVREVVRRKKAAIDGTAPPATWPEKVRKVDGAWVVDIDTEGLPGGYPEQIVVELTTAGGHTRKPRR